MSIGYACIVIGEENTALKSCVLTNAGEETLRALTRANLAALDAMIDYNIQAGIKLFRISSEIIPFASHPVNTLDWRSEFREELASIGKKIKQAGIRVSMHPGQYTLLNSPTASVVENSVKDLEYHVSFLTALGTGYESKVVLHIGGVYGDKEAAAESFVREYSLLPEELRRRIVIENDDKNFTVLDVLNISDRTGAPVIFDNLHHELNPSAIVRQEAEWITLCGKTWGKEDGKQKIHYSQQRTESNRGCHSLTIALSPFIAFVDALPNRDIDIMLEVKDKNLSAVKCSNAVNPQLTLKTLEEEWARYKYLVLGKSAAAYQEIRLLLKDKDKAKVIRFYELVDAARALPEDTGAEVNAAQHVWGYLTGNANETEKRRFLKLTGEYTRGKCPVSSLKNHLLKCAVEQDIDYLKKSYYFYL